MKQLKKALISSAVLAGLAAGNAYAGTEACFEIYKGAVDANHATLYPNADCYVNGVRSGDLLALDEGKIAYELTRGGANGYEINLSQDAFAGALNDAEGLQIVYIPTTDLPGASRIKVKINGAVFGNNANQIFLLNSAGSILATSDGQVNNQSEIEFLTQSGLTIPAGTRMLFSRGNNLANHTPIVLVAQNTTCTQPNTQQQITIAATSAKTDGGSNIIGGVSRAETLIDITPQYITFYGTTATEGQVNAQSLSSDGVTEIVARTEFVFENNSLTQQRLDIISKAGFIDRQAELDIAIDTSALGATDVLKLKFVASDSTGASVQAGIYNTQVTATGALGSQVDVNGAAAGMYGVFGSSVATATQYPLPITAVFTPLDVAGGLETLPAAAATTYGAASLYNEHYFTVTQTDADEVMGFNYTVNVNHILDFNSTALLDHCETNVNTHNIGINGAVLKVPYVVSGTGNFVRITNEHDQEAEVTVDVFGESLDGTVGNRSVTAVKLANVPAKSSYVYFVPDIIDAAVAQKNYTAADGAPNTANNGNPLRHSLTFAVTAPKNTVHGVTVQRLSTGNDRVMPVLDQNDWNQ